MSKQEEGFAGILTSILTSKYNSYNSEGQKK